MNSKNAFFRVLTYHRIAPIKGPINLDPAMISATPEAFAEQMQYLVRHFNVISIDDILTSLNNGTSLPRRAILVSFDDGYHDLLEFAWPILEKLKVPAVIFVATDYINNPKKIFWWDRIANAVFNTKSEILKIHPFDCKLSEIKDDRSAVVKQVQSYLKKLPNDKSLDLVEEICQNLGENKILQTVSLDWQELRKLNDAGITIGAHSRSHPLLNNIPLDDAKSEILGSQDDLKHRLGNNYPIFCYPDGSYNEAIIAILKANGFTMAFTTRDGQNNLRSSDPYALRRTNITRRTSFPIFKFRLTKLGTMIDKWRHK